ncbi:ParD-like family protein [Nitrincola alkalilacustris]|uniref:ParD-like family protein n=1 Tax=Nitrincola alkalilacustris TaxID=1571224 RepID=UPI00124E1E02|nr:ParD-like family protein [Nitrincola alkalilacustris]
MGIVKIDEELHEELRLASKAMSRSINAQAEHWLRMGMLAELYPDKTYQELTRMLLGAHSSTIRKILHELEPA